MVGKLIKHQPQTGAGTSYPECNRQSGGSNHFRTTNGFQKNHPPEKRRRDVTAFPGTLVVSDHRESYFVVKEKILKQEPYYWLPRKKTKLSLNQYGSSSPNDPFSIQYKRMITFPVAILVSEVFKSRPLFKLRKWWSGKTIYRRPGEHRMMDRSVIMQ